MGEQKGWICLHRQITKNWIWEDKPFAYGQAWIDILLMANHENTKFPIGNKIVEVKRGSFITSELKLMDRWGWGKTKLRRFLKLLESDGMIFKKTDRKKTTINVLNYSIYNDLKTTAKPIANQSQTDTEPIANQKKTTAKPIANQSQTDTEPIANTNNNDNNVNNDNNDNNVNNDNKKNKHKYGEYNHVLLSDREFELLVNDYGKEKALEIIKYLDESIEMKGYKYKSHYLAIKKWVVDAVEKKNSSKSKEEQEYQDYINSWRNA